MLLKSGKLPSFVHDETCPSGLVKIAEKVRRDLELVFGASGEDSSHKLFYGILGSSPILDELIKKHDIDVSEIKGRREVYGFFPVSDELLLIAGSDKRGAIYGLFHLSEILGVSPFVNWSDLQPAKLDSFEIGKTYSFISKEPSVEFRGFFINDEWPAFGNWCDKHFGGFTAEMYEGVFELLLRLKGNYLWPAMWSSCFSDDGPGLKSAELADELGIIMGLSHHEPCLRHGEEYSKLRGPQSPYGDAWSFLSNKEGITRFWRDGLKRSGRFENVITVGMRGERDSTILGENATLKDNIDLLRDVLRTQRQLIAEEVEEKQVPLMLALYKEVEAYYYGDENTPGLKEGCDELRDVILMLCDDNHGYLRSLPDENMRRHPGGFGMYYHFDYHGEPVSYEWINSTYLPVVRQQMTTAYAYGIRRLWIVNVGDLGLQELPLSYFLDLAYDYEKWSEEDTAVYMENWLNRQFGAAFDETQIRTLSDICMRTQRIVHNRRPEHMSAEVYHTQTDFEAKRLLEECDALSYAYQELEQQCPAGLAASLFALLGYNLLGGLNLIRLWIYTAYNHGFAQMGSVAANHYSDLMTAALDEDASLRDRLHSAADGKWEGFGDALHIGFQHWNSEECANPIQETIRPVKGKAMVAGCCGEAGYSRGLEWTGKPLYVRTFDEETQERAVTYIFAALCGDEPVEYTLEPEAEWVSADRKTGRLSAEHPVDFIRLEIDKTAAAGAEGKLFVRYDGGRVEFVINAQGLGDDLVVMDAAHYTDLQDGEHCKLKIHEALGRREDALGLSPVTAYFSDVQDAPYADYTFAIEEAGDYTVRFQLLACNPWIEGRQIRLFYAINNETPHSIAVLNDGYLAGGSADWGQGVMSHVHIAEAHCSLTAGENNIRIYGTNPENLLERVILIRKGRERMLSYLGPDESFGRSAE